MPALSYEGRVAVVTGAGSGIGRAHAVTLAARGAKVVVNDRGASLEGEKLPSSPAQKVVDEITALGGAAVANVESVTEESGAAAIVKTAIDSFGRLDIVINNAGIFHYADVVDVSLRRFQDMIDVHVLGPFLVTKAAWPHFVAQGYGRVVNTCSSAGLFGMPQGVHYCAAKAAVLGLTRSLAAEGAAHGIHVNAVAPGASTRSNQDVLDGAFLEWFSTYFTPESVAAAAAWLVHESCDESGQVYAAQGGRVARVVIGEGPGYFSLGITPEAVSDNATAATREDGSVTVPDMEMELGLTIAHLVAAGAPEPPPIGEFELVQK
jgi:NAD(P)-dependent dehydrogenase (short-subunit alcohol dehydrogenase family)